MDIDFIYVYRITISQKRLSIRLFSGKIVDPAVSCLKVFLLNKKALSIAIAGKVPTSRSGYFSAVTVPVLTSPVRL